MSEVQNYQNVVAPAADNFRVSAFGIRGNSYNNITTSAQTTVKSGATFLHGITCNADNISAIRVYDNTVSGGTTVLDLPTSCMTAGPFFQYDAELTTGLTVSTGSTNTNITVIYQ